MKRSLLTLALMTAVIAGCGGGSTSSKSSSSSGGGGGGVLPDEPTPPPEVTAAAPLALQLFTQYDGTEAVNLLNFTETGTTSCTSTDATPSVTCTVVVPEGRLYFSSLNLQFSWLTSKCKLLTFVPYAYKASESATYTPPGADAAIDCSVPAPTAQCYGGAGPQLISTYPKDTALIYIPDESKIETPQSKIESIVSAFSKKWGSNRQTVNDLPLAKRGTAFTSSDLGGGGDGYIANSFVTYQWTCRDDWFDLETYTMTLNVTEEDSESGAPANQFRTWKEAP